MKKRVLIPAITFVILIPVALVWPITLVRVGYIDIDIVIQTYAERYLETEITMRQDFIRQLRETYREQYFELSSIERMELQRKIQEQDEVLDLLIYNRYMLRSAGDIQDDLVFQIVQRDIMEAIKKTSELEGYSLVIDNSGNFVYGSEDINLTDKVLFRLDEKLLDLQNSEPLAPLELELDEYAIIE